MATIEKMNSDLPSKVEIELLHYNDPIRAAIAAATTGEDIEATMEIARGDEHVVSGKEIK